MTEPMNEPAPPLPDPAAGPTEPDEEAVLVEMYGEPDADGVYRGETQDER